MGVDCIYCFFISAFYYKILDEKVTRFLPLLLLIFIWNCSPKKETKKEVSVISETIQYPEITLQKAEFPFTLDKIDLNDSSKTIATSKKEKKIIKNVLSDFYFNTCMGDSSETYFKLKDNYIKTFLLKNEPYTIYYVLLEQQPTGRIIGKMFFYNNTSKTFNDEILDYYIYAMYNFNENGNGKITPSNLKELFKITAPDIKTVDFDKDGKNELKFNRLYHNGTANAIETTILKIDNQKLDTLSFEQKWIK